MSTLSSSGVLLQTAQPFMPTRRLLGAYFNEAKFEFIATIRTIALAVPFLALPVLIYLLFGVGMSSEAVAKNPSLGSYLLFGFSVLAVSGPGIFAIGCTLAMERDAGLMKLKRAWPAPPGSYLLAKMMMAMLFATITFSALVITAFVAGQLKLSASQLAEVAVVMIVGAVPFCAMGMFIGAYVSGSAAPAVANLIFLPMIWLGGLFIPLPKFLQWQAVVWPSFHLAQVAAGVAGLKEFHFVPTILSVAVLVGVTVLFGGLAIHRLARKG